MAQKWLLQHPKHTEQQETSTWKKGAFIRVPTQSSGSSRAELCQYSLPPSLLLRCFPTLEHVSHSFPCLHSPLWLSSVLCEHQATNRPWAHCQSWPSVSSCKLALAPDPWYFSRCTLFWIGPLKTEGWCGEINHIYNIITLLSWSVLTTFS